VIENDSFALFFGLKSAVLLAVTVAIVASLFVLLVAIVIIESNQFRIGVVVVIVDNHLASLTIVFFSTDIRLNDKNNNKINI